MYLDGYSRFSTILSFGLNKTEIDMLMDVSKTFKTYDKALQRETKIRLLETDEVSDIYAIPNLLAFINAECLSNEDLEGIIDFFKECAEPLPPTLVQEGYQKEDFKLPPVYIYNYQIPINPGISGLHINQEFFNDKDKLRLAILSEIKTNEGKGKASESSIRISRVLRMYKCLLDEGRLTKQRVDDLCDPDRVSQRMFYKDVGLINDVEEGRLVYDRNAKAYVLKD